MTRRLRDKTALKTSLSLCLLFALGYLLFSIVQEDPAVDKILSRLEKKYEETEAVSCRFTQTKRILQLEGPITTTGRLYFKKPHYLRVEHQGEENLIIYCNGEKIWLEDLDLEEVEVFDFKTSGIEGRPSRLLPPVFTASTKELKTQFIIRLLDSPGSRLKLVPRPASGYTFASLEFDVGSLSRIQWMKIEYANGDWTEMRFRSWKSLPEISDYFFEYMKE